jgi:release factor glutamine methyltransferase
VDTVGGLLTRARALGVARLDAQLLIAHHLLQTRSWLLAHDDAPLSAERARTVEHALARRAEGVPLAYLVGEREFHGLVLQVTPAVLVPRPETEGLVDWALERLTADRHGAVVDLGTGSGAIALALKHRWPEATLTATDTSPDALAVARANAARLGLGIEFIAGDWWQPLAGRRFDLAVSNPPYIAATDPHLAALAYEPRGALTPEGDGLDALRRIVAGAPAHLRRGGWLLLEHGYDQADAVTALLAAAGFEAVETRVDMAGRPRTTGGRWAG